MRKLVGRKKIVGVSTHRIEQARQAVLDGADYIGAGPIFGSSTKPRDFIAGLDYARQVAAEIMAQFAAFAATGLRLDHVNAHKHFHLHPVIGAELIAIGQKFGAPAIRVPTEPVAIVRGMEPAAGGLSAPLLAQWTRVLRAQARRAGMATPDAVFGLAWSGAMTRARLKSLLERLPAGVVEILNRERQGPV